MQPSDKLIAEKIRQVRKEDVIVRLVVSIFLGAVLHAVIFLKFIWPTIIQVATSPNYQNEPYAIQLVPIYITVTYLATSFVYSILATASFGQKRIVVSPLLVQIASGGLIVCLAIAGWNLTQLTVPIQQIPSNVFIEMLLFQTLFLGYGFAITKLLTVLTGLSGNKDDLHILTLNVELEYLELAEIIGNKLFMNTHNLIEVEHEERDCIIVKTPRSASVQLVVVLTPENKKIEKSSIIAIVAYEIMYNSIFKSEKAWSELRDLKHDILGIIKESKRLDLAEKIVDENYRATQIAIWEALSMTRSVFSGLERPHYGILAAIGAALVVGGVLSYPLVTKTSIDFGGLITVWVTIATTIISIGVSLALQGARKKRSKFSLS